MRKPKTIKYGKSKSDKKRKKSSEKRNASRVNIKHKDTLFRRLFTSNKSWTLALYNAMNGTSYTDPDAIEITTIDKAVYMSMKNDLSFLIMDTMNFYEHQSTYNPNMPMRMLIYAGMVYAKYVDDENNDYDIYSGRVSPVPLPRCVCFYNGETNKPDRKVLRLSDAFTGTGSAEADIEVTVTMININYGHNRELMEACRPLSEYSWFIQEIRNNVKKHMVLESAVDEAIDRMPEDFVIRSYLTGNRSEVKRMCITEFDEKKFIRNCKREAERERERADQEKLRADNEKTRADEAEIRADNAEAKIAALQAEIEALKAEKKE